MIVLLDKNKPFYKANFHCHSAYSDGKLTVEELKKRYLEKGYSIIAFTDHEHLLNHSYLNDESFLAITSAELAIKEFPNQSTLKNHAMRVCHLNIFAKQADNIDTPCYSLLNDHYRNFPDAENKMIHSCGDFKREYSADGINEIIRIANEKGFLVSYNHPRWSLENACDYLKYENLWAVEIFNNSSATGGLFEYDIYAYDDFLRSGRKMACVMGDDNHNYREDSFGGFNMVNAETLNYQSVISAMEEHRFYCSQGPIIRELYIDGMTAHLSFEEGTFATMSTFGRRAARREAPSGDRGEVEFTIDPTDGYIRFDVVDKFGRRANTNAYFLEDLGIKNE